jgi:glycine oxidase
VRVIEKRSLGAGSSGGIVGALAPHVPENWNAKKAFQFEALRAAGAFWQDVAQQSRHDPGYARLGRVQPVADSALELAHARAKSAADLWHGFASWQVIPAADAPGLAVHSASGFVIHDTLSARLHPRRAGRALVAALQAMGAEIICGPGTPSGPVVWATGHEGLADLTRDLGRPIGGGVKGQSVLLRHDCANAPQVFVDGLHIVPHLDGTVAIGSTSERDFTSPDSVDAQCDALLARVRTLGEETLAVLLGAAAPADGGQDPRVPGLLPAREPDRAGAGSDDLITALVTSAGDSGGERSRLVLELIRDPMVGDLGAWQRDPLGVIALVRSAALNATDASSLDAALLEIPGELTRVLGYATAVAAAGDTELARHAAVQGGARLGVVLVAIELAIEALGGTGP